MALKVYSLFKQKTNFPISLCWNKPDVSVTRNSSCNNKPTVRRSYDFFMESINAIKQMNIALPNTLIDNHHHFSSNIPKDHSNSSKFIIYHQNA
jgi:hypothetical protein